MLGALHQRIVDGVGRAGGEGLVQAAEIQIMYAPVQCLPAGGQDVGAVFAEFVQELPAGEKEHAAVPEVVPRGHELLGALQLRLLHEAGHLARTAVVECRTLLDVAISGFRGVWNDAEGRQAAVGHGLHAFGDGGVECGYVAYQVVGGE